MNLNDWGTGKPYQKHKGYIGDISRPAPYYLGNPAVEQPYDITSLKRSLNRAHDSLIPDQNHTDVGKREIGAPFSNYHPYTSHISKFETIPGYTLHRSNTVSDFDFHDNKKWIIKKKISGNPYRVELFTSSPQYDHLKKEPFQPIIKSCKQYNRQTNNVYPSPNQLIKPTRKFGGDNRQMNEIEKQINKTTYQVSYNRDSITQRPFTALPKLTSYDRPLTDNDNVEKPLGRSVLQIPFNSALFSHYTDRTMEVY